MRTARPRFVMDQRPAVAIVYVAALFMNLLDITIVNVALPTIGRQFNVQAASVDVVVISFLVSLAVFIPASGWIGDRFGGKKTLLLAVLIFTAASGACGASQSLTQLVIFRAIQGIGGGMLTPVGMAMLYRTFPASERVRLASMLMIPTALGPALGPVVGGLFVTDVSWRWVFFLNLPVGAFAFIFGLLFVHEQRESAPGRFDLAGFVVAGVGLASFMYGVSEGPTKGWASAPVVVTTAVGVILLVALIAVERRVPDPMVDLTLYRDRLFAACNLLVVVIIAGFLGLLYVVPLYYQDGRGLSALQSGLSTFPEAVGVMIGSQFVSRVFYPVVGPRRLIGVGAAGLVLGCCLLTLTGAHTSLWWLRANLFYLGVCMPFFMVTTQAAAFATISPAKTGRASTLYNSMRQVGSALGVALLSTVIIEIGAFHHRGGSQIPNLHAYHVTFFISAGLALLGGVLGLMLIHDEDAASTMVRRRRPASAEKDLERVQQA